MEKYDLIIVGAGPAGIFTAVELFRRGAHKKILMVEKGQSVEKRSCPKSKTQKCLNCQPCNITTGFSGAGAFSDGKLSLNHEVGGDFPNLVGPDFAQSSLTIRTRSTWNSARTPMWRACPTPIRSASSAAAPFAQA